MPGVSFVQAVAATVGDSATSIELAFGNAGGNIGLAYVLTEEGTIPANVEDDKGNNWYLFSANPSNLGTESWWVCPILIAGATVTANGVVTTSSYATMILLEYEPPGGPIAIQALQPYGRPYTQMQPLPLTFTSQFMLGGAGAEAGWWHTLIVGLHDCLTGETTLRTWSATPDPESIAGGLRISWPDPTGVTSQAVADSTVPSPNTRNSIVWGYDPYDPTQHPHLPVTDTLPSPRMEGILISTTQ